ncbi:MAG: tRNA (adenosine(37)-N6)-threonylcarbamoyltransferase complex transferase subunit TsaD [bacterium]|nr:tRNA (adenosine(37)-N6)-threonylcarbamoyltransferase complex transferase subunit TsaD [bacterium]
MIILGIETSCDETAVALLRAQDGTFVLEKNLVSSQIDIHAPYGGVVPEVAAREHIKTLPFLLKKILGDTRPDAIAVTAGPGLITSLLIGVQTAKTLASAWGIPLVRVNHIEAHLLTNWLENPHLAFPTLGLIVSGGHTELVLIKNIGEYDLLGRTRDDAVGECFDKVAQLLGLGYPGGPEISQHALQGDALAIILPRPMIHADNFEFSFSGLKTAVLYLSPEQKKRTADVCAAFQKAVIDVLISKTLKATRMYDVRSIVFGGGVMANTALRTEMQKMIETQLPQCAYQFPGPNACTDNATMVAVAGYFHIQKKDTISWQQLDGDPNWEIEQVNY